METDGMKRDMTILLFLVCLFIIQGMGFHWSAVDDAYISFRFAKNFAQGHGLVFNVGDPVEGYTNFLWTILLGLSAKGGLDIERTATVLGVGFGSLSLVLTWLLSRNVARERNWPMNLALVPPAILALNPSWPYWAWSGMEGSFQTCLVLAFLLVAMREPLKIRHMILAGILGAMMIMVRWEAILLWPVVVLVLATHARERNISGPAVLSLVLFAIFGTYFLWRLNYYGQWMPNTYYAKIGGTVFSRIIKGGVYTGELILEWLLPVVMIPWLIAHRGRWFWTINGSIGVYIVYATWTGGDHFPWLRFFLPILPLCAVVCADMVHHVIPERSSVHDEARRLAMAVGMIIVLTGIALRIDLPSAQSHQNLVNNWKKIGQWTSRMFSKSDAVALAPVGVIGYEISNPIIDVLGLTDRQIAHFGVFNPSEAPGHQKSSIPWVLKKRPRIILGQAVLFSGSIPSIEQTIERSACVTLKTMYKLPEFNRLYEYKVGKIGQSYLPYWELRNF